METITLDWMSWLTLKEGHPEEMTVAIWDVVTEPVKKYQVPLWHLSFSNKEDPPDSFYSTTYKFAPAYAPLVEEAYMKKTKKEMHRIHRTIYECIFLSLIDAAETMLHMSSDSDAKCMDELFTSEDRPSIALTAEGTLSPGNAVQQHDTEFFTEYVLGEHKIIALKLPYTHMHTKHDLTKTVFLWNRGNGPFLKRKLSMEKHIFDDHTIVEVEWFHNMFISGCTRQLHLL